MGDGVAVYGLAADGNTPQLQAGSAEITLTLSGLTAGKHSLLAYHNNTDGYNGPKVDVYVDDVKTVEGVAQTSRAMKPSESGQSYVTFNAQDGKDVRDFLSHRS